MADHDRKTSSAGLAANEAPTLQRARELSARKTLKPLSIEDLLRSVPEDWQPGEANVDEFLASLRGRGESK